MTQITKVGHFYMAQLGHYHVAATVRTLLLTKIKTHSKIGVIRNF